MAKLKTKPTAQSVEDFLNAIPDEQRRKDCFALVALMKAVTKAKPKMWGSMIGFGEYHYKYASGHEGDIFVTGFSPRKNALTLYCMCGGLGKNQELLKRLGKCKTGKGCLYIKRLEDIDAGVLKKLISESWKRPRGSCAS